MAVFEWDSDYSLLSDDDIIDNDDDFRKFEDDVRLAEVRNSILGKNIPDMSKIPTANTSVDYSIRLAMNTKDEPSATSDSSNLMIDDSLRMYLTAPPLVRRTIGQRKACLSIDPTIDESDPTALAKSELFVGNIPYNAKQHELKNWFINRGYGVIHVHLQNNKVYHFLEFQVFLKMMLFSSREVLAMLLFDLIRLLRREMSSTKARLIHRTLFSKVINYLSNINNDLLNNRMIIRSQQS